MGALPEAVLFACVGERVIYKFCAKRIAIGKVKVLI